MMERSFLLGRLGIQERFWFRRGLVEGEQWTLGSQGGEGGGKQFGRAFANLASWRTGVIYASFCLDI